MDCIFCKIIKGDIPSNKLFEDEDFLVFLDAFPIYKGHTLIIPKNHHENILDLPENLAKGIIPLGKKIIAAMEKSLDADGYNFFQNNKEHSGQQVMHYHMHIVPRYKAFEEGGIENLVKSQYNYEPSKKDLEKTASLISSHL